MLGNCVKWIEHLNECQKPSGSEAFPIAKELPFIPMGSSISFYIWILWIAVTFWETQVPKIKGVTKHNLNSRFPSFSLGSQSTIGRLPPTSHAFIHCRLWPQRPIEYICTLLIRSSKCKEVHWTENQEASGLYCSFRIYRFMRSSQQPSTHMWKCNPTYSPFSYFLICEMLCCDWSGCLLSVCYLKFFSLQN